MPEAPEIPTFMEAGPCRLMKQNGWYSMHRRRRARPARRSSPGSMRKSRARHEAASTCRSVSSSSVSTAEAARLSSLPSFVRSEFAKYARLIKDAGIKAE